MNLFFVRKLTHFFSFSTIYNKDFILITPIQNYYSAKSIKQYLHHTPQQDILMLNTIELR